MISKAAFRPFRPRMQARQTVSAMLAKQKNSKIRNCCLIFTKSLRNAA